jgi:hypothetical protein
VIAGGGRLKSGVRTTLLLIGSAAFIGLAAGVGELTVVD